MELMGFEVFYFYFNKISLFCWHFEQLRIDSIYIPRQLSGCKIKDAVVTAEEEVRR